jgi:hypothetical protein
MFFKVKGQDNFYLPMGKPKGQPIEFMTALNERKADVKI